MWVLFIGSCLCVLWLEFDVFCWIVMICKCKLSETLILNLSLIYVFCDEKIWCDYDGFVGKF